jgi:tetratricopeptide (TPR) repeat protein
MNVAAPANAAAIQSSRPLVEPAPSWVLPAQIPAVPAAAEGSASIDLLSDEQIRFGPQDDSTYYQEVYKIASPEGLGDADLRLDWDPSLETLAVHKYQIVRDGKTIDLLGDGSKISVIRRETNIDSASLDGELTAIMQPPDIRVGDVIDLSFTRTRRDPALNGKSEALEGPSDGHTYGRYRLRMLWPDSKKLEWRKYPGILDPKLSHSSAGYELLADVKNVTTPLPPAGAPAHYRVISAIDISEFPDWRSVVATLLPLYERASALSASSPVKAEAQRIAAATTDPVRRAEIALQLVQEQVRYLFVGMNDGGYVPATADLTWSRKFGDCKGKTVLLTALLRELGIEAEPVLVNTENGDLVAHRLPAVSAFDHVLVRAHIGGRTYWLDGTGLGDTKLSRLTTPPYQVGLPLLTNTQALIPLVPDDVKTPNEIVTIELDATAGIDAPAPAVGEMRFRGADAPQMRQKYAGLSAADLDKQLRELWHKSYDFILPDKVGAAVDDKTGDFVITLTGTAKMDWYSDVGARWYEVDRSRIGWKFDIDRTDAINKDAPFEIDYPDYWESREIIKLPDGGNGFRLQGDSIDEVVDGTYALHRKVEISDGIMTMDASTRTLASELPASKAEEFKSELEKLANIAVFVRVPDDYMATAADIKALQGNKPALAVALMHRGAVHFDRGEFAESLADENAAIAIDPTKAPAQAIRALTLAIQNDPKADEAADRALSLDSKQNLAWRAKGLIAAKAKRYDDADAAFSKALAIEPNDPQVLAARSSARLILGRFADSLADAEAALSITPKLEIRIVRATALAGLKRKAEALAEADRAVEAQPDSMEIRRARAMLRSGLGEPELAIQDYDELLRKAPQADFYLARAQLWPSGEEAKQKADVDAALRLDPRSTKALALHASLAIQGSEFGTAKSDIAKVEAADPDSPMIKPLRLQLLEAQGRGREALALIDGYIAKHSDDAGAFNERCWTKATLNIELETAIADCNASLKLKPDNPATLDSRAFAELRLGNIKAALADYDAALKVQPELAASLYGRAIVRSRAGDHKGALSDIAEARKLSSRIDKRFAGFGIQLPSELAPSPAPTAQAGQ